MFLTILVDGKTHVQVNCTKDSLPGLVSHEVGPNGVKFKVRITPDRKFALATCGQVAIEVTSMEEGEDVLCPLYDGLINDNPSAALWWAFD